MAIHHLEKLEAPIVYGIVNEKLRLECGSLDALIVKYDLDANELQHRFDEMGCYYDADVNQLRQK
ncbi:DUF4250 domain-containing protein [Enterovibrio sp. Hal110]